MTNDNAGPILRLSICERFYFIHMTSRIVPTLQLRDEYTAFDSLPTRRESIALGCNALLVVQTCSFSFIRPQQRDTTPNRQQRPNFQSRDYVAHLDSFGGVVSTISR